MRFRTLSVQPPEGACPTHRALYNGLEEFERALRQHVHLENNIELTGRMDQINRVGDGKVEVVDYKTGRPKTEVKAEKDLQLSVYALAAREVLDVEPVRLIYYNLQTNQCVSAGREEKALNQVRSEIQEVAADIRAREFPAQPSFVCKTCDFRPICPAQESTRTPARAADSERADRPVTAAIPGQSKSGAPKGAPLQID